MPGQPATFDVARVIPVEPGTAQAPAVVVQAGDNLMLHTYLQVGGTPIIRAYVNGILLGAGAAFEYHLQDLETGAVVPAIAGGAIIQLTAASVPTRAAVLGPGGELEGFPDLPTIDYYLSQDTAAITTGAFGSGAVLQLSGAASQSGTWRILAHVHGGAGSLVSAFGDNEMVTVIA